MSKQHFPTLNLSQKTITITVVVTVVVLIGALAWFFSPQDHKNYDPLKPVPVPIAVPQTQTLRIGLIYSLTNDATQGSGWVFNAEGAQIAIHRLKAGKTDVELVAVNDYGTDKGASEAVSYLADKKVSGIVVATSGSHTNVLAQHARTAGIPAIFLYEASIPTGKGIWTMAPEHTTVVKEIKESLKSSGLSSSLAIVPKNFDKSTGLATLTYVTQDTVTNERSDNSGTHDFINKLRERVEANASDSFIIFGDARFQAEALAAIQAAGYTFPVYLAPEATNSLFDSVLAEHGSFYTDMYTYGISDPDVTSLSNNTAGSAAAAFLAALRTLGSDNEATTLDGTQPYSSVALYADTRSHDAVLAFAYAAAQAGSTKPDKVKEQLSSLTLTHSDGIAGEPMSFSETTPYVTNTLSILTSTSETLGIRDISNKRLYWYREAEE